MTFRRWDEIPDHERESEATIRRRWEQHRDEAPDAPWVAHFEETVARDIAVFRERVAASCEAAVSSYGGVPPYAPCLGSARPNSPYCANHTRAAANAKATRPRDESPRGVRCSTCHGLGWVLSPLIDQEHAP